MTTTIAQPTTAAVHTEQLTKVYGQGDTRVVALDHVTVDFRRGQFTAIMGPSGSGKSTLMHCAAGLDTPTEGRVVIGQVDATSLNDKALTLLRRRRIGFIFQSFNLLPTMSARENILLPLKLAHVKPDEEWFTTIVTVLGLTERLGHRPGELSGGQAPRVAIGRGGKRLRPRPDDVAVRRRIAQRLGRTRERLFGGFNQHDIAQQGIQKPLDGCIGIDGVYQTTGRLRRPIAV